jgi:uncharacterized protein (DUF849 family)
VTTLIACLNGVTSRRQHPRVPYTPEEIADQARRAVVAGADALHIHPRDPAGAETFEAERVAATLRSVRDSCPGIPVGLSTGLWVTDHDADRRLRLVEEWTGPARPDFASVNVREEGAEQLAAHLHAAAIGIEAGVWSVDDAQTLVESEMVGRLLRVLVEPRESDPVKGLKRVRSIDRILRAHDPGLRTLHHGAGATTWPIMRWSIQHGHDIRVGLEDTTFLPDDRRAQDNQELIEEAVREIDRVGRSVGANEHQGAKQTTPAV